MVDVSGFNAAEVPDTFGFDAIPAGNYTAIITESCEKPTRKGDGSYIQFTFEIVDGEHKSRKLWARLNMKNPSAMAQQMAMAEFSAICRAVGNLTPMNTEELHGIPITIKVKCVKAKFGPSEGEMTNEIKGYQKAGGAAQAAPQTPQAKTNAPPWQRK